MTESSNLVYYGKCNLRYYFKVKMSDVKVTKHHKAQTQMLPQLKRTSLPAPLCRLFSLHHNHKCNCQPSAIVANFDEPEHSTPFIALDRTWLLQNISFTLALADLWSVVTNQPGYQTDCITNANTAKQLTSSLFFRRFYSAVINKKKKTQSVAGHISTRYSRPPVYCVVYFR